MHTGHHCFLRTSHSILDHELLRQEAIEETGKLLAKALSNPPSKAEGSAYSPKSNVMPPLPPDLILDVPTETFDLPEVKLEDGKRENSLTWDPVESQIRQTWLEGCNNEGRKLKMEIGNLTKWKESADLDRGRCSDKVNLYQSSVQENEERIQKQYLEFQIEVQPPVKERARSAANAKDIQHVQLKKHQGQSLALARKIRDKEDRRKKVQLRSKHLSDLTRMMKHTAALGAEAFACAHTGPEHFRILTFAKLHEYIKPPLSFGEQLTNLSNDDSLPFDRVRDLVLFFVSWGCDAPAVVFFRYCSERSTATKEQGLRALADLCQLEEPGKVKI